ncbi:DUF4134 domain-containing protein [Chitinophaga barathri]|nr:DUF4134 domain-containing protein [Chitinophaga barathri]
MKREGIVCNNYQNDYAKSLLLCAAMVLLAGVDVVAQQQPNAGTALNNANTSIRTYFTTASQIMYACGGIVGLVGAIKVYSKWNEGDNNTGKIAAAWFSSCIFLVLIGVAIKTFFGIS